MNIGIIVYSQTGNTFSVAQMLKEKLENSNHQVKIDRIILENENNNSKNILLKTSPEISQYDVIIFGSPVQAFSLSAPMKEYLGQVSSLENKKIACFVTKALPFNWTGGNNAIRQMKRLCDSKKGKVVETGIIKWIKSSREKSINEVIKKLSGLFD